jgi:3'-phosphoadenosine 5'-phosphosulfate sulfotransferase (PAPS reductase)/FAD synthetase
VLFYSKVAPLTKALKKFSLITGLRAEQSENRNDLALLNTIQNLK